MAYIKKVKRPNGKTNIYIAEKSNSKTIVLEKLGILNKDVSMSQAKVILARHLERRQPLTSDLTLSMLLDEFVPYYETQVGKTIKEGTFKRSLQSIAKFESLLTHSIRDIQFQDIENLKGSLPTLSNRSINIVLADLNKVLKYSLKKGYIFKLPDIQKLRESSKEILRLTKDQLNHILKVSKGNPHFYIYFMAFTGLRPNEFLTLRWQDINLTTKTLNIVSDNKLKRGRLLPLDDSLIKVLSNREPKGEQVCPYTSKWSARNAVLREGLKIGITNLSPYSLRKTFGSMMAENGVDPFMLSKFMGHSSINTTYKHYVNVESEKLRKHISLHPLASSN